MIMNHNLILKSDKLQRLQSVTVFSVVSIKKTMGTSRKLVPIILSGD